VRICKITEMNGVQFPGASGATLSVPFPVIFATPIRNSVFISWKIMKSFSTLMEILIGCRHKKVKHIFSCWHHLLWNKKQISPLSQKDRWVRGLLGLLQNPKHQLFWKPRESPVRKCCSLWSSRLFWHLKLHNSYHCSMNNVHVSSFLYCHIVWAPQVA